MMYSRTRVVKEQVTRVVRKLPGKGQFAVSVGDYVTPETIIGRSEVSAGFHLVRLAELLSIAPSKVQAVLFKKLGERVFRGEVLAVKKSFLHERRVDVPSDGILESVDPNTGDVTIRFLPVLVPLVSGYWGRIVQQEENKVVIVTRVAEVRGILGVGHERSGIVHNLALDGGFILPSQIDSHAKGHILCGGGLISKDAIAKACAVGVNGIIAGGIHARDFKSVGGMIGGESMTDIGTTLLIIEGFGRLSFGSDVATFASTLSNSYGFIDGRKSHLIIPRTVSQEETLQEKTSGQESTAVDAGELQVGRTVRIIAGTLLGRQGTVTAFGLAPRPSVSVDLGKEKIDIPVENIELVNDVL